MKKKISEMFFMAWYPLVDFALIAFAIMFSYKFYRILGIGQQVYYQKIHIIPISLLAALLSVFILQGFGVYKRESSLLNVEEIKNTIKGITSTFLLFGIILVFGKISISRYVLILSYLLSLFFVVSLKMILYHVSSFTDFFLGIRTKILIYGAGALGQALFREISNSPKLRIIPVGFIDDDKRKRGFSCHKNGFQTSEGIKVLGCREDIDRILEEYDVDQVYGAISNIDNDKLIAILEFLKRRNIKIKFVPNLYKVFVRNMQINKVGEIPIISEADHGESFYLYFKRYMDIFCALFTLIMLSPLFLIIAFAIKFDTKGPAIFKQNRVGKNGAIFTLYKFRTMYLDTDPYAVNPLGIDDERITRVGKFLRKTSLDELPQVINVLKGDMSFVGPRPEMLFIVEQYSDIHRERLKILPGITGLWQLSGDRKKAIHENMDYDLYYIRNVSFFLDVAILIETLVFAFKGI